MLNLPGFEFDERRHIYKLDGVQIPSVTKIMRSLSRDYYGTVDPVILAAAAKRGKEVHQGIENFLKFGIDDIPPEHEGYYQAFKAWYEAKQPEILTTESRIYHKTLRYAGTADLICVLGCKGTMYLVDFKTSFKIADKLARVQSEAYAKAFESHGITIERKAIVQLKSDSNWHMQEFDPKDHPAWSIFGGLLEQYHFMNE